jgi:hypothetical protein
MLTLLFLPQLSHETGIFLPLMAVLIKMFRVCKCAAAPHGGASLPCPKLTKESPVVFSWQVCLQAGAECVLTFQRVADSSMVGVTLAAKKSGGLSALVLWLDGLGGL